MQISIKDIRNPVVFVITFLQLLFSNNELSYSNIEVNFVRANIIVNISLNVTTRP